MSTGFQLADDSEHQTQVMTIVEPRSNQISRQNEWLSAQRRDFIKFDPEKILDMSVTLERQKKLFVQCAANIMKKVDSTRDFWQSDSATLFAEKIKELDAKSAELAAQFQSFSKDLEAASGIYRKGEADAKRQAQGLPTDGVFRV